MLQGLSDVLADRWLNRLTFYKQPTSRRIFRLTMAFGIYALVLVVFDIVIRISFIPIHGNFYALVGAVLSMLLVFRTNTAYDRWWEGRKLWGQLVNDSRNLALKAKEFVRDDAVGVRKLGTWTTAFALSLKHHLRGERSTDGWPDEKAIKLDGHQPARIAAIVFGQLAGWRTAGKINDFEFLTLERHAAAFMDVCGGCERILKTPISISYRNFIRESILMYLFSLPWGIVDEYGFWTVAAVALVAYFMCGLEAVAEDVEQPFGTGRDDLKLDDICEAIRASVAQIVA